MKKLKVLLALILVAALFVTLFAACGNTETNTNTGDTGSSNTGNTGNTGDADTGDTGDADTGDADTGDADVPPTTWDPEDVTEIEMYYFDLRMVGADHGERINALLNEYLEPNYGVHANITYFVIGEWIQKIQLAISSGEQIDVLPLCAGNGLSTLYANTMLMNIEEYMAESAPQTMELMAPYLDTYRYPDGLFGVPTYRGYCTNGYMIMRKDILEEVGMLEVAQNLDNWNDYEAILGAVADKFTADTGLWALSKGAAYSCTPGYLWDGDNFSDIYQWDSVGDSLSQVLADAEGNISWIHDDPRMEEKLQRVASWADNGWIYPDSALIDTHGDELMKQGVTFSTMDGSEYGVEAVKGANCGYELVCPMYYPGWVMTSTLTGWGIGVPVTAEEPEAACRMIEALYTDEYVMNLITRGEEGVDFNVVDGEVVYQGDSYYYEADFLIGNNTLLLPLEGQGADYFEEIKKINAEAHISEYLGFVLDTSALEQEIANLTAVSDQYTADIFCGNYTPELYAEFKDKLVSAGVHDYLAEIQSQLAAWYAANK